MSLTVYNQQEDFANTMTSDGVSPEMKPIADTMPYVLMPPENECESDSDDYVLSDCNDCYEDYLNTGEVPDTYDHRDEYDHDWFATNGFLMSDDVMDDADAIAAFQYAMGNDSYTSIIEDTASGSDSSEDGSQESSTSDNASNDSKNASDTTSTNAGSNNHVNEDSAYKTDNDSLTTDRADDDDRNSDGVDSNGNGNDDKTPANSDKTDNGKDNGSNNNTDDGKNDATSGNKSKKDALQYMPKPIEPLHRLSKEEIEERSAKVRLSRKLEEGKKREERMEPYRTLDINLTLLGNYIDDNLPEYNELDRFMFRNLLRDSRNEYGNRTRMPEPTPENIEELLNRAISESDAVNADGLNEVESDTDVFSGPDPFQLTAKGFKYKPKYSAKYWTARRYRARKWLEAMYGEVNAVRQSDGSAVLKYSNDHISDILSAHSDMNGRNMGIIPLSCLNLVVMHGFDDSKLPDEAGSSIPCKVLAPRRISDGASCGKRGKDLKNIPTEFLPACTHYTLIRRSESKMMPATIVVDVDAKDSLGRYESALNKGLIPQCSFMIVNHANGHAQFSWIVPSISERSPWADEYAILQYSLTKILNGDEKFRMDRCQNPFSISLMHHDHDVIVPGGDRGLRVWSLKALKKSLLESKSYHRPDEDKDDKAKIPTHQQLLLNVAKSADHCGLDPSITSGLSVVSIMGSISPVDEDDGESDATSSTDSSIGIDVDGDKAESRLDSPLSPSEFDYDDGSMRMLNPDAVKGRVIPVGSRNSTMFRVATWMAWNRPDVELTIDRLHRMVVCEGDGDGCYGLSEAEVTGIIRSVRNYYNKHKSGNGKDGKNHKNPILVELGRRGGSVRSKAQVSTSSATFQQANDTRRSNGMELARIAFTALVTSKKTRTQVAKELGISRSTLYRSVTRVFSCIMARSLMKTMTFVGSVTEDELASRMSKYALNSELFKSFVMDVEQWRASVVASGHDSPSEDDYEVILGHNAMFLKVMADMSLTLKLNAMLNDATHRYAQELGTEYLGQLKASDEIKNTDEWYFRDKLRNGDYDYDGHGLFQYYESKIGRLISMGTLAPLQDSDGNGHTGLRRMFSEAVERAYSSDYDMVSIIMEAFENGDIGDIGVRMHGILADSWYDESVYDDDYTMAPVDSVSIRKQSRHKRRNMRRVDLSHGSALPARREYLNRLASGFTDSYEANGSNVASLSEFADNVYALLPLAGGWSRVVDPIDDIDSIPVGEWVNEDPRYELIAG